MITETLSGFLDKEPKKSNKYNKILILKRYGKVSGIQVTCNKKYFNAELIKQLLQIFKL